MIIKAATELNEFLQIHQLNYKTFVEEIPQHQPNTEGALIDKFHYKNKYIIAKRGDELVGMVCYHAVRPFSLDAKIDDLDKYLPVHKKLAEIRLLSVKSEERKPLVTYRLLQQLCADLIQQGIDAAVISGTTRQLHLYLRMGFVPFGNLVGTGDALFQPMFITLKELRNDFRTD